MENSGLTKIFDLINSGTKTNIRLALQLLKGGPPAWRKEVEDTYLSLIRRFLYKTMPDNELEHLPELPETSTLNVQVYFSV